MKQLKTKDRSIKTNGTQNSVPIAVPMSPSPPTMKLLSAKRQQLSGVQP